MKGQHEMKRLTFPLLVLALFLAACSGSSSGLTGVTWKLVSYGPPGDELAAVTDVVTSLVFGEDGKVSGNMGCNSFGGDYTASGSQITFGPLASTLMACDPPIMNQETGVLGILSGKVDYKVSGTLLTITNADGTAATFSK
jgi:heat shock protein HslJ